MSDPSTTAGLLLAAAGAGLVLALALGARDLVRDLIGGAALRFGAHLRAGDLVEVGGRGGIVERIGLRSLTLRDDDGAVHVVPAGDARTLTNRSYGRSYAIVDVPVPAGDELDDAVRRMAAIVDALRREPGQSLRILGELEVAGLEAWDREVLTVRARVRVAPGQGPVIRRELLTAFRRQLGGEGERARDARLSKLTVA